MDCLACTTPNPDYARFCLHCGARFDAARGATCPQCRAALPAHARFCFHCGNARDGQTAAPPADKRAVAHPLERLMPKQYVEQLQGLRGRVAGERRIVTILFSDVKGSTAMAEHLDPEEVMEIMNGAFEVLIEPIYRYEGTLARLMGDAILAFFGAPIAHEDDPERAARAALDIVAGARGYAEKLERERGISGFNVRVGINTGLVVVGEVGADLRVEYTAMGDTVNMAARMESAAEPGTIYVTADTHKRIAHAFETHALGPTPVKGKSEPVNVFRLMGLGHTAAPAGALRAPMVGRDAELACIQDALRALRDGKGGQIAITGEAGFGKTRLVAEARKLVTPHASPVTWVEGHCLSYTEGMSYWVAREILRGLLGLTADVPASQDPNLKAEQLDPLLAHFLELALDAATQARLARMAGDVLQKQMWLTFCEYVRARAAQQPLVLVWEDLHWIDSSSLDLLETLAPLTDQAPILLLLVFRPNEGRMWETHARLASRDPHYRALELAPLTREQGAQLIQHLAVGTGLTDETRELILQKAEGNPFFLEEVVRALLDSGLLSREKSPTVSVITKRVRVPDTLQGVIMTRLDRLPPADKFALQTAAVIGRVFSRDVLARVLGADFAGAQLPEALGELVKREFILAEKDTFTFRHNMTLEVTYNSLLLAQRKKMHQQVGEAMEELHPDRVEELAPTLANHFEKAENRAKALDYLTRAAERAARVFANREAIGYYQRALTLASAPDGNSDDVVKLREALADLHYRMGEYPRALEQCEHALASAADAVQRAALKRKMGQVCEKWGKRDQAIAHFEAGLREMREAMDAVEAARIYAGLGFVHYRRGEMDAALQLSQLALDLMEREDDQRGIAQACNNLGIVHASREEWARAIEFHERCLAIRKKDGDAFGLAASHNNLGLVFQEQGEYRIAAEHFRASILLCEKTGDRHGLAFALDNLGQVYQKTGESERAMECLKRAVTLLYELGESQIVPEMWQTGAW